MTRENFKDYIIFTCQADFEKKRSYNGAIKQENNGECP